MSTPIDDLRQFLDDSPSPHHVVRTATERLRGAGFEKLELGRMWQSVPDAGYVQRDGFALAWRLPTNVDGNSAMQLVGVHTDSPNLRISPRPDFHKFGWHQLQVEVYGGVLYNTWLDRDLGVAGRITGADGTSTLVNVSSPVARVPQLAVHLDRGVNDALTLNPHEHLRPVWGSRGDAPSFAEWIGEMAGTSAPVTWELGLYDIEPARVLGADQSMLASGRLDNQLSCWAAVDALIASTPEEKISVVVLNDHEEVGSETATGAAGPGVDHVLERLYAALDAPRSAYLRALAASLFVSADNAHAIHPNYPERHDPLHAPMINGGPVIKVNARQRYATTSTTAAKFAALCESVGVEYQWFTSRNDVSCGSTIGPITATRLGIDVVDVGVAQLSMHSARELCGVDDPPAFRTVLTAMFSA